MQKANVADHAFVQAFETGALSVESFNHRAHVRIAYVYLTRQPPVEATESIRRGLASFLALNNVPLSKYHETLTRAWVLAVHHFMQYSAPAVSAGEFIDHNPSLLDPQIMLTHYSPEILYSVAARRTFVPPDRDPIPTY